MVISFQVIGRLAEHEEMLAEIRRVLRTDGILVISSQVRSVYSLECNAHDTLHVDDRDLQKFDVLLRSQFSSVVYYGQWKQGSSVIQVLNETTGISACGRIMDSL